MNAWLVAGAILLLGTVPCAVVLVRNSVMERLVALQAAQVLVILTFVVLAEGYGRDIYIDLALTLAVLSLAGGLVFIRFLERWL